VTTPITVVTGSRKGIGRHLAGHYAGLGHRVIGCSRGAVDWEAPGYVHHQVDITAEAEVRKFFGAIRKEYGVVHNLINNAGIASMNHALLTPGDTVDKVMRTNLLGTFLAAREAANFARSLADARNCVPYPAFRGEPRRGDQRIAQPLSRQRDQIFRCGRRKAV
jgi:3-oxoacyl-[acyl-carrier protein] reductase